MKSFLDQADRTRSVDDLMTDFGKTLGNTGKQAQTFGERITSGFKTFGRAAVATLGNVGLDLLIGTGIQLAANAWQNYANKQEDAIQRGETTLSEYKQQLEEFSSAQTIVTDVGERFEELSKGVSSTGLNLGLTTSEYEEYQNIVSQLASAMPSLVDGYDSQGNAIINLGSSAASASVQLNKLLEAERQSNNYKIAEQAQTQKLNDITGLIFPS